MLDIQAALGRKILCLAVIFNSIISMLLAGNLLYGFYTSRLMQHPYWPYLLDGTLLWFVIAASFLNIIAAKILGNVDLKRIKFHHYFYGFIASTVSFIFTALFAPTYLSVLLMPMLISNACGSATMAISAAFFLLYGGMTLIIDDIQDISLKMGRAFNDLKKKLHGFGRPLGTFHLFSSALSTYVTLSIILWAFTNGFYSEGSLLPSLSARVFALNFLITSLSGLGIAKKGFWLKNLYMDQQRKRGSSSIKEKGN